MLLSGSGSDSLRTNQTTFGMPVALAVSFGKQRVYSFMTKNGSISSHWIAAVFSRWRKS
jgi:hypothetical protein